MFVRVRQGQSARGDDPEVAQFPLGAGQGPADLWEGRRPAELAEQHGDKVATAVEDLCVPFGGVVLHRPLELPSGEEMEELAEDTREKTHS